jgi:hypothetical protein
MRWFRSHVRFGARLALFALALQIALSFGHVHVKDLLAGAPTSTLANVSSHAGAPPDPAPNRKSDGADPICAICALTQLVSTSVTSTAPALPLPDVVGYRRLEPVAEFSSTIALRRPFGARAPPLA